MSSSPRLSLRRARPDAAASEVIGSILMVAITVAVAAGFFTVVYSSMSTEEQAVSVSAAGSLEKANPGWGFGEETAVIHHQGGDPLSISSLAIVVEVQGTETRYTEDSDPALDHPDQTAFSSTDRDLTIGERWESTELTIGPSDRVEVLLVDTSSGDVIWSATNQAGTESPLSYVQTPLGMVTGTATDGDNARSATDGGAAATLTEAATGTQTTTLSANEIVGTSDFTPGSNVFTSDQTFATTSHSAAVYSGSEDQTLRKIDLSGTQVWSKSHNAKVLDVTVGRDGHSYIGGDNNNLVKVAPDGSTVWTFTGHTNKVLGVAADRDGFAYTASEDNTARKIDSTGSQVWSFTGHTNKVHDVAVDRDGFVYTASEDNTVRKIDSTGSQVWSFTGHTNKVFGVAVDRDGFVYSASEDGTVRKIDSTGSQVWSFTGHTNKVFGVAVDNDWRQIRAGMADQTPQGEITQLVIEAEVRASATANEFRLQGCLSGGSCTDTSTPTQVGTTTETISFDITTQRPGGGSWTWSDVNDLEAIVEARATQGSPVTLEIDHLYLEITFDSDHVLETDAWTFDPLSNLPTQTLELRYRGTTAETYEVQIWDGSTWVSQTPSLDQGSFTLFSEELSSAEVAAGPQIRILDQGNDDPTEGSLELDYVRVVGS